MKIEMSRREETTDRIIAAAGSVFAERGFRGTTIRLITARAGVNVAAVNYHFKNKAELYAQVLREAKKHVTQLVIADIPGSPEEQLRIFIRSFVHNLLDPKRPAWHARVMTMEMSNPTPALGVIIREVMAPVFRELRELIDEIVGGTADAVDLDLLAHSVCSQCVFYVNCRPMAEGLSVHLTRTADRTDRIAEHAALFSLAALKDFRRKGSAKTSRTRRGANRYLALS